MATLTTDPALSTFPKNYKAGLLKALDTLDYDAIGQAIQALGAARRENRQIFVCGNGGSASTASHFACDMVKGASFQHDTRFRILALTDSMPTITAYSNDVSYESAFVEQLKNFANPGDVVITISGSGNSPNLVSVLDYANSLGCETIALTGRDGGKTGPMAKVQIRVAEPHMGRIEDAHLIVCHMIAYYFMEK